MVQTISLQVSTDLNELSTVLNWFEQLSLSPTTILKKDWLRCKTALAEGFTNAVRHAHKDLPKETPILLEAILSDHSLEMRIFDYGSPFDLSEKLSELSKLDNVDVHAVGGRGLDLLRQLCDVFSYNRMEDNRNCLLMIKYFN